MEALVNGYTQNNLVDFYYMARAILVKNEAFYDQYDQAFAHVFYKTMFTAVDIHQEILKWLSYYKNYVNFSSENFKRKDYLSLKALKKELDKRIQNQTKRHDGGNFWIGTKGTSSFGHSGFHHKGLRISGTSNGSYAVQIAIARHFRNYRTDVKLNIRQIKIIFKQLRQFVREGVEEEIDVERTIDKTCREGGEIELVFSKKRKNALKLLLLMDSGGSMTPYSLLVTRLFSAAYQINYFHDFKGFFFHNCIYQNVYKDINNNDTESTSVLFNSLNNNYKVVLVGDAYMSPSELFEIGGAIDYYNQNEIPGIEWLKRIATYFRYCVWLNPLPKQVWIHPTIKAVGTIFPMFPLTIDGLENAIKKLMIKS